MNPGKSFEMDFRNSVPDNWYILRLTDAAKWLRGQQDDMQTRFIPSNPYDFVLYYFPFMFALELKSTASNAFAFASLTKTQEHGLINASMIPGILAGIVVNFRQAGEARRNETYFMPVDVYVQQKKLLYAARKSIPYTLFRYFGHKIPGEKKRTHYRWDIRSLHAAAVTRHQMGKYPMSSVNANAWSNDQHKHGGTNV